MLNNIQESLSALRMLLSGKELVSLKDVSNEDISVTDEERVIRIDQADLSDIDLLKRCITNWYAKNTRLPEYIICKDVCTLSVGSSAAQVRDKTFISEILSPRRMENKIAVVTGGAQGFGAGIADEFFAAGANLVIADLNAEVGLQLVEKYNSQTLPNKAIFVQTDVAELSSVERMIKETVLNFGGVDVMISNAGILRAGGLDEMTAESFELMTKVNYIGYFNCAKASAAIMKIQDRCSNKHFYDIIQINSKSGLKGSNKNFAYAGGKFGGIGLTQSFALELMPYNIKVNSICPGNFFDGPLWADPEKGLFVQYLNTGKVPGASTIEEVKKFYEKQVPAGRGCGTLDVARAAFYAIEQEYETGQAIPVTGGQNMLH